MTSRDFAYWLQGFFEISQADTLTEEEVTIIKKHLSLVFKHEIDPSMEDAKHLEHILKEELRKLHSGPNRADTKIMC